MISEKELSHILQRPGYSVAGDLCTSMREPSARKSVIAWQNEREFQRAVIDRCDAMAILRPEYGLIYHISNENAHRNPGVRAGVPDLHMACARGGYHSLYIELKIRNNKPSQAQRDMIYKLQMEGNKCAVIWDSVDDVIREIQNYLDGPSRSVNHA